MHMPARSSLTELATRPRYRVHVRRNRDISCMCTAYPVRYPRRGEHTRWTRWHHRQHHRLPAPSSSVCRHGCTPQMAHGSLDQRASPTFAANQPLRQHRQSSGSAHFSLDAYHTRLVLASDRKSPTRPRAFHTYPEVYPSADSSDVTATHVQVTASLLRPPFQSQHFAPEPTLFSVAHTA